MVSHTYDLMINFYFSLMKGKKLPFSEFFQEKAVAYRYQVS